MYYNETTVPMTQKDVINQLTPFLLKIINAEIVSIFFVNS